MSFTNIQEILPLVKKPSRYIGGEINSIKKDHRTSLSLALCFPDVYEIGTSHFGLQILYHILNRQERISAERVFAPGLDMERCLRSAGLPLVSLESKKPLAGFDIIGFSLLYELNYTNMLNMLDLAGVPLYAGQRDIFQPLIIAGGPCTFNPEPVADFFDAMVIGDGEEVVLTLAEIWLEHQHAGRASGGKAAATAVQKVDKAAVLKAWSAVQGVYVPSFYDVERDDDGRERLTPRPGAPETVVRAFVPELKPAFFPDKPVVPFGKPIHDRLRLEIARGCSRGCRFCQAGMIYRPVRERPVSETLDLAEKALCATGYDDISLLSLSTGDYSDLNSLMEALVFRYGEKHIALSVPSFRAGSLDEQVMKLIRNVRKTGFTIAPEAGSQDLRNLINKNITEAEIIETVKKAFDSGWNLIKVYFMVGLPEEGEADLEAIVRLVRRLVEIGKKKGRQKKVNVSVATFVPKAHTPFQWEPQISLEEATEKIFWLKRRLSGKEIGFKWQHPQVSLLEGVFARGDRRLSKLLETAFNLGCRFDGWSDGFDFDKWQQAAGQCGIKLDDYTCRERFVEEPLPWDHIASGIAKAFFVRERENGYNRQSTPDCRHHECLQCGICDFENLYPRLVGPAGNEKEETHSRSAGEKIVKTDATPIRTALVYSKKGAARFFGHLEFANVFIRALYRAGIPLIFSKGFHPKPRVVFGEPLPVGVESERETVYVSVSSPLRPEQTVSALNRQLPEGITVLECRTVASKAPPAGEAETSGVYKIVLKTGSFNPARADAFLAADSFLLKRNDHKGGSREFDAREIVARLMVPDEKTVILETRVLPGKRARPGELVAAIFDLAEEVVLQARIVKQPES